MTRYAEDLTAEYVASMRKAIERDFNTVHHPQDIPLPRGIKCGADRRQTLTQRMGSICKSHLPTATS